jgi:hypothetical protein
MPKDKIRQPKLEKKNKMKEPLLSPTTKPSLWAYNGLYPLILTINGLPL